MMLFTVLHLAAIVSVMTGSFIAGFWYANNSYVRHKKTVDSIRKTPGHDFRSRDVIK